MRLALSLRKRERVTATTATETTTKSTTSGRTSQQGPPQLRVSVRGQQLHFSRKERERERELSTFYGPFPKEDFKEEEEGGLLLSVKGKERKGNGSPPKVVLVL